MSFLFQFNRPIHRVILKDTKICLRCRIKVQSQQKYIQLKILGIFGLQE